MNKMRKISVRITEEEYRDIVKQAAQKEIDMSSYVRFVIDANNANDIVGQYQQRMILKRELIYEINKIGNNINQITRNNNSELYSDQDKRKLFQDLEDVKQLMKKIIQ